MTTEMSAYSMFIFKSRYSRWLEDKGRRENWTETVDRYIDFFKPRIPQKYRDEVSAQIRNAILEMDVMPSMRALMTAGKALTRDNIAGFNCSFLTVNDVRAFDEAMYISMCGTGVGFSVEDQFISKLPVIAESFYPTETIIKVKDSRVGWASGFRELLSLLYAGRVPKWDLSSVRAAGIPLKTFGGRASGPGVLDDLFRFCTSMFQNAAGRKLSSLECHDLMCKIAEVVVCGGVRRSAMLSLSNLSDDRMRSAKSGHWWKENPQRALANNSAVYTEMPDMGIFLKEWMSLYESRSGERGIFNRMAAEQKVKQTGRREWEGIEFGINPCITADTWIHTNEGPKQVLSLIGRKFIATVDGKHYPSTDFGFIKTGEKRVFRISTNRGYRVNATKNHEFLVARYDRSEIVDYQWKPLADIKVGDRLVLNNHRNLEWEGCGTENEGWLLGNLKGDGNICNGHGYLDFWGSSRNEMLALAVSNIHTSVAARSDLVGCDQPQYDKARAGSVGLAKLAEGYMSPQKCLTERIEETSSAFHRGFIRGWFDADGSVQKGKSLTVRLTSIDLDGLRMVQRMLLRLGIACTIYENRRDGAMRELPDGHGGMKEYWCESLHELCIANDNLAEFASIIGFSEPNGKLQALMSHLGGYRRSFNKERFLATVVEIKPIGIREVFDCTIPSIGAFDANGIYVHNCAEILLRPQGLCNLSEVVIRPWDSEAELVAKVRVAAIIGTLQSTLTDFRYLRKEWKNNADEERLLGVSLTGVMDNPLMSQPGEDLKIVLDLLKKEAVATNKKWSEILGINQATAVSCVKPSGTVSQLVNTSPGIHARFGKRIARAVRNHRSDPISSFLKSAGVPCEPDITQPDSTDVFYFPLESPEQSVMRNQLSAVQQLELYSIYRKHWCEHNVSSTIQVREQEWLEVANWVYKNFNEVCGLSFLPYADHIYQQAPYRELSQDEYKVMAEKMPVLDWSKLSDFEKEDMTTSTHEMACSAGFCELAG